MAEDCPECMAAAAMMRRIADGLSAGAGGTIGAALGGLTRDPMNVHRGRAIGAAVAPSIIERGSLAIAGKVKQSRSRKTKKRDKTMSKAMKKVSKKARLKSGKMKKGWSQSRIMREAHKECKRMMK